ncbi:MAG: ribonuclease HII [Candidatus Comchoanobacterales bacterium]
MTEVFTETKQCLLGVDEVGRGPLAGPVVAAAVILPAEHALNLTDSKQLSERKREALVSLIQQEAVAYAIGEASVAEIESLNILQASLLAMRRAILAIKEPFDEVWVDGIHAPDCDYPVTTIIKGDAKVPAISAASILAKVYRDQLMIQTHQQYPQYGFDRHKGYGTKQHMDALKQFGPCALHRKTFAPISKFIEGNHD